MSYSLWLQFWCHLMFEKPFPSNGIWWHFTKSFIQTQEKHISIWRLFNWIWDSSSVEFHRIVCEWSVLSTLKRFCKLMIRNKNIHAVLFNNPRMLFQIRKKLLQNMFCVNCINYTLNIHHVVHVTMNHVYKHFIWLLCMIM